MNLLKLVVLPLAIIGFGLVAIAQSPNSDSIPVVSAVAPMYPPIARTANATGDVTLTVEIDRDGKVTSVESKSGHPLFRKSAEEAARRWVFGTSATSAKRKVTLTFLFRLIESDASAYEGTSVYYPPYKIEARAMKVIPVTTRRKPNKSLDASGVSGLLIHDLSVAQSSAAASTQPLCACEF
jgi:TonB family protein